MTPNSIRRRALYEDRSMDITLLFIEPYLFSSKKEQFPFQIFLISYAKDTFLIDKKSLN
jgi:hypothetical protein